MKAKISLFGSLILCFLFFAANAFGQEKEPEEKIRQRVEDLFVTIREEKWNELARFVIVSTDKKSPETRRLMNILENDSPEEITKKVGEYFKQVYGFRKPGKIISITI